MAAYPGGIASFAGFVASHTLAVDAHAAQHNLEQAEIVAAQTKIGTGASTPTANKILRGTGTGTSAWAQADLTTDVTGVLPVANGGTGQSSQTGTGLPVAQTSPTIITPTVASFTNAQHNHSNAAGGGQLNGASAITDGTITPAELVAGAGTDWATTDISGSSTIVGWASFTVKQLRYRQVGKFIYVFYYLAGTSNDTATSFTVPVSPATTMNEYEGVSGLHIDNGAVGTQPRWNLVSSGSVVTFFTTFAGGGWTASGSKDIRGTVVYETP